MSDQPLFDPGLQPERTELAWRRTALALAVGALIALRLLPAALGSWALSLGFAGLAVAAALWILARRRARHTRQALLDGHRPLPGGGLLLLLTAVATVGAALGLLYVAVS